MASATSDRRMGLTGDKGVKAPCTLATTGNITLSGEQTIDGVLTSETRVLVKNQTTASQNGVYKSSSSAWTRDLDFNGNLDVVEGTIILVNRGTTNADTMWRLTNTGTITIDTTSLTFERAAVNDSNSVAFLQSGTGAVETTVQVKDRLTVNVFDFFTAAQIADVEANTALVDVSAAINACTLAHPGKLIWMPPGTYMVDGLLSVTVQVDGSHFSPVSACLALRSNMHLRGTPGKTIIKAKSNIDASNDYWNLFMSNTYDTDLSFDGITFDMNGQNNPVVSGNSHQAGLFWGGASARPDNLRVTRCIFKNSAGLTGGICTGFSITTPAPLGVGLLVEDCQFIDNGFDVDDHSTIYSFSSETILRNNRFTIPNELAYRQNAFEIHAPDAIVTGNVIADYAGGGIIYSDGGSNLQNVDIYGNFFQTTMTSMYIGRATVAAGTDLFDINIHDNVFEIIDALDDYAQEPCCISILPTRGIYNIFVYNNTLIKGAYVYATYGILIGNATAGDSTNNISIRDNWISGFTRGIELPDLAGVGSVGYLEIVGNTVKDAKTSTTPAMSGIGIVVSARAGQTITTAIIEGNKVINPEFGGIYVSGTITNYKYDFNYVATGSSYAYYGTGSATITNDLSFYREGTCSPTIASSGGAIATYTTSIKWTKIGREVTYSGLVTITDNGTGSGTLTMQALPFTAAAYACGVAREAGVSGAACTVQVETATNTGTFYKYDNTYPAATGAAFRFVLSYPCT